MKADSLEFLSGMGLPVPPFHIVWSDEDIDASSILKDSPGPFSVRSSYQEEDGDEKALAGAFLTLLNVPRNKLGSSIKKVFKSYQKALRRSENPESRQCVIVQQMVDADISGIMFTSNPLGLLNEASIVVGDGKCDAIVEDRVETDLFSYNKDTGDLRAERTGQSRVSDSQLDKLAALARQVESAYGKPRDVEFSFAGDALSVLQARPITALPDSLSIVLDRGGMTRDYPGIVLPLSVEFANTVHAKALRRLLGELGDKSSMKSYLSDTAEVPIACVSGRLYHRLDKWHNLLWLLPDAEELIPSFKRVMGMHDRSVPARSHYPLGLRLSAAKNLLLMMRTNHDDMTVLQEKIEDVYVKYGRVVTHSSALFYLEDVLRSALDAALAHWDAAIVNKLLIAYLIRDMDDETAGAWLAGLYDSSEHDDSLRCLAGIYEEEGEGSERFKRAEASHLALYAHWGGSSYKLESEVYETSPELLHEHIRRHLEEHGASAEQTTLPVPKNRKERMLAQAISDHASFQYERKMLYGLARRLFRKCGELLTAQGRIARPEDVFYLNTDEIFFRQGDIATIVSRRKELYYAYPEGALPRRLVFAGSPYDLFGERVIGAGYDYDESYNDDYDDVYNVMREQHINPFSGDRTMLLRGYGTSRGTARGTVVIVSDPDDLPDCNGRIIVAPSFDPRWVPALKQARGLVAERGSLLSHSAIIIRELGKPAVTGLKDACTILRDGDSVELDGLGGTVYLRQRGAAS